VFSLLDLFCELKVYSPVFSMGKGRPGSRPFLRLYLTRFDFFEKYRYGPDYYQKANLSPN
jgi:hypothetical protein